MTQKNKELLLKDLCAKLPYGVKVESVFINLDTKEHKSCGIEVFDATSLLMIRDGLGEFKPYLFPLSSMTEEQKDYIRNRFCYEWESNEEVSDLWKHKLEFGDALEFIQWCYENHLDINSLIPMDLAIDAIGLNIY